MEKTPARRVIVIGGGGGIGGETAREFARRGCRVVVADQDEAAADRTAASITSEMGGIAAGVRMDVTDYADVSSGFQRAAETLGGLDVMVNCVGWNRHSYFVDQDAAFWERIIAINLLGQLHTAHAALQHLSRDGDAAMVLVASDAGRVGTKGETPYSAAKGGVIALSKSLARELSREGIRVNCVSPGPTQTPMLQEATDEQPEVLARINKLIPLRRIAEPREQARAIVFLASPESSYITGQTLSVNGGLNML